MLNHIKAADITILTYVTMLSGIETWLESKPVTDCAMFVFIAVLGGLAKLHQGLAGKPVPWLEIKSRCIISLFIGVLCYFFLPPDARWSVGVTGLLGWMGTGGIVWLIRTFLRRDVTDKHTTDQ